MNRPDRSVRALHVVLVLVGLAVAQPVNAFLDIFTPKGFREFADNTLGLKKIKESTRAVEMALNRDSLEARQLRLAQLHAVEQDITSARQEAEARVSVQQHDLEERIDRLNRDSNISADTKRILGNLLSEHLQVLTKFLEIWSATETVVAEHVALVGKSVEEIRNDAWLNRDKNSSRGCVYLPEFFEANEHIDALEDELKEVEGSQGSLKKERGLATERITSWKREIERKNRERDDLRARVSGGEGDGELSEKLAISDEELALLQARVQLAGLRIKKFDRELERAEELRALVQSRLIRQKHQIDDIKKILMISQDDLEKFKKEALAAERAAREENESILIERRKKGDERSDLKEMYDSVLRSLENLTSDGRRSKDKDVFGARAKELRLGVQIRLFDLQMELLDFRGQYVNLIKRTKEFMYESVQKRERLRGERESVALWIDDLVARSRILESDIHEYDTRKARTETLRRKIQDDLRQIDQLADNVERAKEEVFGSRGSELREVRGLVSDARKDVQAYLDLLHGDITTILTSIIDEQKKLFKLYGQFLGDVERRRNEINMWQRSESAVSWESLIISGYELVDFGGNIFEKIYLYADPKPLITSLARTTFSTFLGFILFLFFYWILFVAMMVLLRSVRRKLHELVAQQHGRTAFLYWSMLACVADFLQRQLYLIFTWAFVLFNLKWSVNYGDFILSFGNPSILTLFHVFSIPIFLHLARELLSELNQLNTRLSFFFFNEKSQSKFITLTTIILYAGAIILPIRSAMLVYPHAYVHAPDVLSGALSLLIMVVLLLFFSKEEVLAIVPSGHWVWTLIRPKIDKYYNVISFFVMGLFILNNPYVGYASLAWYLLAFIPISVAVIYGAALIHHYLRQQSLNFFVEERDEELEDRFEYAKMYYGFFVIISFFVLFFGTFALLSKVWNLPYTPSRLWYLFSQEWVLPLEFGKFGLVEFITVVIFLFCGYVISSVGKHFVISRILDIFNAEDGARNTFSRIFHYTVVMLSFIAGCFYVGLSYFVLPLIVALLALIGFGAKDMVTDFAAGLLILLERHIEIGHFIKTPVIRGTIYSISARTTTIRTAQNYFVFIPNRELISKPIVNWGCGRFSVGFEMKIEVSYDNNPEHVMSVIKKMLYAHPLVLRVPPAVIRVDDFCDSGILYFTRAFVSIRKVREQWDVASELRVALYKAFTDEGISMPYPRRVIQYDPRPVAPDVPPSKGLSIMFDEEPFGPSQTGSK